MVELHWLNDTQRMMTVRDCTKGVLLLICLFLVGAFAIWLRLDKIAQEEMGNDFDNALSHKNLKESENIEIDYLKFDSFANSLLNNAKHFCDSNLIAYKYFAKLNGVILDPNSGEFTQIEGSKDKKYIISSGFFQLGCDGGIEHGFENGKHLNSWREAIKHDIPRENRYEVETKWTLAISRNDNSNLYLLILDIYNAYLLCKAFDIDPAQVTILFIDGYEPNDLDNTWQTLFNAAVRIEDVKKPVLYEKLIWGMDNSKSPLNYENEFQNIPNLEEFREFVLARHQITPNHKMNCDYLKILIVHSGEVFYKNSEKRETITAEGLFSSTSNFFSDHQVVKSSGSSFHDQLKEVSNVDILIGIHKEDLTHVLFLPKSAAMLEVFPVDVPPLENKHYHSLANWRNISYYSWGGPDRRKMPDSPLSFIGAQIAHMDGEMMREMCVPNYKRKQIIWS